MAIVGNAWSFSAISVTSLAGVAWTYSEGLYVGLYSDTSAVLAVGLLIGGACVLALLRMGARKAQRNVVDSVATYLLQACLVGIFAVASGATMRQMQYTVDIHDGMYCATLCTSPCMLFGGIMGRRLEFSLRWRRWRNVLCGLVLTASIGLTFMFFGQDPMLLRVIRSVAVGIVVTFAFRYAFMWPERRRSWQTATEAGLVVVVTVALLAPFLSNVYL